MKTSAPRSASRQRPGDARRGWCARRSRRGSGARRRARRPGRGAPPRRRRRRPRAGAPAAQEQLEDGRAGRARRRSSPGARPRAACPTTRRALRRAASATMAVPCWSSWKTGMSSSVAQPGLDLEAARRRDVLEVDPREHRRDRLDGADDLLGVGGVEADREGVDVGEPLEQRRLALHHRQRRERADVAQAEHRRAVGDHRDGVALDGEPAGVARGSRRWPGRPAPPPACRSSTGRRASGSAPSTPPTACRRGAAGRCGRETRPISTPSTSRIRATIASACSGSWVSMVRSMRIWLGPGCRDVEPGDHAPGRLDDPGHLADRGRSGRQDAGGR